MDKAARIALSNQQFAERIGRGVPPETPEELKTVLFLKYGERWKYPDWVFPFLRAVKILGDLDREEEKMVQDGMEGMLDEVWKKPYLAEAERELLHAVKDGNNRQTLPLTWLSDVYIRLQAWSKAREVTLRAVQLDHLQPSLLVSLSLCLEKEGEYTKAHKWLRMATTLYPATRRGLHQDKLARLREQADKLKAESGFRDPFNKLPLEIVLQIMGEASQDDPNVVLRMSWTNKLWRQTLLHHCPELWGTLKIPWSELKTGVRFPEKRKAWIERSGKRFHTVEIGDTLDYGNLTAISKMKRSYVPFIENAKRVRLHITDNKILRRLCAKFPQAFDAIQDLYIDGGSLTFESAREAYPNHHLHCGLAAPSSRTTLKSMEISNVDFRDYNIVASQADDHFHGRIYTGPKNLDVYPQLQRLIIDRCAFSMFEANLETLPDRSIVGRQMNCILHRTLSSAPELRYFKFLWGSSMTRSITQRMSEKRIETKLETVIIPPPAVYAIDICAPRCQSLKFELPIPRGLSRYQEEIVVGQLPLIPTIEDSPVDVDNLARLTSLGFVFGNRDKMSRLVQWLSQVPNLAKLAVGGASAWVSQRLSLDRQVTDQNVDEGIFQALIDHPDWLPNLTDLQLEHCKVPDQQLIDFVKMRKESNTMASLTRLSINRRAWPEPSEKTHAWLHWEISGKPWLELGSDTLLSSQQYSGRGRFCRCDSLTGKYEY